MGCVRVEVLSCEGSSSRDSEDSTEDMRTSMKLLLALCLLVSTVYGQLERPGRRALGSPVVSRAGSTTVALLPFTDSFSGTSLGTRWTGATWTVGSGVASNTPLTGGEILTNGNMETWSSTTNAGTWSESISGASTVTQESVVVHGGSYAVALNIDASNNSAKLVKSSIMTIGDWYMYSIWRKSSVNGKTVRGFRDIAEEPLVMTTTYQNFIECNQAATDLLTIGRLSGTSSSLYADDVSLKRITLLSTLAFVEAGTQNVTLGVKVTRGLYSVAGLLVSYKDTANMVVAVVNGWDVCRLDKCVGGTWSTVITGAITYVAGATIRVEKDGNNYSLYYNGTQVGSTTEITDAALVSNTKHGLFSTYSGNTFDDFYIYPYGAVVLGYSGSSVSASSASGYYPDLVDKWAIDYFPNYKVSKSQTAIGGCGTWNALARFYTDIAPSVPRIIIHDTAWQGENAIDRSSMEIFIRRCAQLGATPVIILSATVADRTVDSTINNYTNKDANDTIRAICSYYGVSVVDWPQRICELKDAGHHLTEYFVDAVHHTALGDTVMSRMIDTVLMGNWSLPDTSRGYRLAGSADFARAPASKLGTERDSVSGSWTTSGDTLKSSEAGAIIYFSGTFSSFGTGAGSGSSDFMVSVDGGAFEQWSLIGQPQNGYYIGTYGAHSVALKVNSGSVAINKFYMM